MKKLIPFFIFGLLLISQLPLNGFCQEPLVALIKSSPNDQSSLSDRILKEISKYIGTPYKKGGSSGSGVDCSGFARLIYRKIFNVDLPYIASNQARLGIFQEISLEQLSTGDLIFFTATPEKKRINHVGIYLINGEFVHSIEKGGVDIASLSDPHWKVRVKTIKRIKDLPD
ncbi:MAG: C40 family peptidase [Deltaproteobacteria bacterium]|nr:C40 family peptidase [Deltaproteobacteria bacterium]